MRWLVVLFNAAGSRREYRCRARSESAACALATRDLRKTTGERWYASHALASW